MAERTGIPKRTLDKYMSRYDASLPGYEALVALSKGLGVSLDWLVFGRDFVGEGSELLAAMAAEELGRQYFEMILRYHHSGELPLVSGEEVLGLTPEEWGADLAARVGQKANELASKGITREELLNWDAQYKDRAREQIGNLTERRLKIKSAKT